jgi:beta,beta-carotene 9',10'-dioxygenase
MTPSFFQYGINTNQQAYSMQNIPVSGKIPEWLEGNYIRNGPGMFNLNGRRVNHWFDAMGALHSFNIRNGKVDYVSRYIECESFRSAAEQGTLKFSEFATDPCKSIFKKVQSYVFPTLPNMTDNPKIHVARIGERYMALGETPMQVEFDPQTLEKIGVDEIVPGAFAYKTTAHPHFEKDHAYNLVVKFGMQSYYRIYDMVQKKKHLANVPVAKPAYMHGFGMSERYFIIAAGPLVVVPIHLLFWKKPYIENHQWLPQEGAKIWVIEKSTGKTKAVFETEAFFCFHHINAWEEGDEIVMDIDAYDDADIINKYYLKELERQDLRLPEGKLRRYRLDLTTKKVKEIVTVSDACIELPRIDYDRFNMKGNYRFAYGVGLHPMHKIGFYNSIVKIDTKSGDASYWHQDDCYPGEPYFISSPGSKHDAEGVLLSVVLDAANERSFLLVLDANSLDEIARATVPEPIVYGFHGEFFSN